LTKLSASSLDIFLPFWRVMADNLLLGYDSLGELANSKLRGKWLFYVVWGILESSGLNV